MPTAASANQRGSTPLLLCYIALVYHGRFLHPRGLPFDTSATSGRRFRALGADIDADTFGRIMPVEEAAHSLSHLPSVPPRGSPGHVIIQVVEK